MKKIFLFFTLFITFLSQPLFAAESANTTDEVYLPGVPLICQHPEMPNGCEIVAATMFLNYYGITDDRFVMAKKINKAQAFTRSNGKLYGGNPKDGFVGNPLTSGGIGSYVPPVAALINAYLPDRSLDLSGGTFESLLQTVASGRPVIAWVTLELTPIRSTFNWYLKDGTRIQWPNNSHTVVIVGFNETQVIINNPTTGKEERLPLEQFKKIWLARGSMAISVKPVLDSERTYFLPLFAKSFREQVQMTRPIPSKTLPASFMPVSFLYKGNSLSKAGYYIDHTLYSPFEELNALLNIPIDPRLYFTPIDRLYRRVQIDYAIGYHLNYNNKALFLNYDPATNPYLVMHNNQPTIDIDSYLNYLGFQYTFYLTNGIFYVEITDSSDKTTNP